jgi:DNA repair protein RecN (Recombination protein N)
MSTSFLKKCEKILWREQGDKGTGRKERLRMSAKSGREPRLGAFWRCVQGASVLLSLRMLTYLHVKNLALVEDAAVEFGPGLNVVTGETGAGKSILVGALYLLLGERASPSTVRAGADKCVVEAHFSLDDPSAADAALEEAGMEPCEGGELVLRRVIRASGGGQAYVNDVPATLPLLKRLGARLVDLHGPHDHQSLFRASAQLEMLDALARDGDALAAYEAAWAERRGWLDRLEELSGPDDGLSDQIEMLSWRVKEIDEVAPTAEEETEIRAEHETLGQLQRVLELGQTVVQAATESDASALAVLAPAQKAAEELARLLPDAADWADTLRSASATLAGLSTDVQRRLGALEADGDRLEWLDNRLAAYERLKRKYGPDISDVLAARETAAARLAELQSRDARRDEARREIARLDASLRSLGATLHKAREKAAARLAPVATAELRALAFARASFEVSLSPLPEPGPKGLDAVEFVFAPNAGEPPRPLRAIASSGEISRVMLALKVVLAGTDPVELMVFDEIDANVGGETAHAVGRKLRQAAAARQIVAITHLAPVAACGQHHFAVRKGEEDGRTVTRVESLGDEARVAEITRMLGGEGTSPVVRQHAAALLEAAGKL